MQFAICWPSMSMSPPFCPPTIRAKVSTISPTHWVFRPRCWNATSERSHQDQPPCCWRSRDRATHQHLASSRRSLADCAHRRTAARHPGRHFVRLHFSPRCGIRIQGSRPQRRSGRGRRWRARSRSRSPSMEPVSIPARAVPISGLKVAAGPHTIGVAMPAHNSAGEDDVYGVYADNAGVTTVAITGPTNPTGPGDTPSRRKIFVCHPSAGEDETACAKRILTSLAAKAFRRPVRDSDLETLPRLLPARAQLRRLRAWDRSRGGAHSHRSLVHLPLRERAGRRSAGRRLPGQRYRTGIAAVILPLEQHSR